MPIGLLMDLRLDTSRGTGYRSPAQRARVLTQSWALENLYCLACEEHRLKPSPEGQAVVDFRCRACDEAYQLKSRSAGFGRRIVDAAYEPMRDAIVSGRAPNLLLLEYRQQEWRVRELSGVPRLFLSESVLEKRKPLAASARRAGWVGCNILLDRVPDDARVYAVQNGRERPAEVVREEWSRYSFLSQLTIDDRSWLADVLRCIRQIGRQVFALPEVYAFHRELAALHPMNRHVHAKIRQQLQVLRDHGILEFLGGGRYRIR